MRQFECTFQIPALVFGILGFLVCFAAILTPAWQVVYARELQQWIQSGLWLNCQTRPNGMYTCTYTFSESDFDFYTSAELINLRTPPFYAWQRKLLAVIMIAQISAFIAFVSFCCSFHEPATRISSFAFTIAIGLAVVLHTGSDVAFSVLSQMVEYRFYHVSVSGIYEKHRGYSFYLELFGTFLLVISLILSIVHLLMEFRKNSGMHVRSLSYTGPTNYKGDMYYRDGIPDNSQEYHPHAGSIGYGRDYQYGSQYDEDRFAMRELPPIPNRYR